MQGICEKKSFLSLPGAVKCYGIFVFSTFDTLQLRRRSSLRAGLVPVVNRIYQYASFAVMSYLRRRHESVVGFMRAFEPGIANTKPSMRNGTSE